jgi:threonylcarbamoyladenosine tRNA methylthiotransferase MtaB
MPPVNRKTIKTRAAALREAGEIQVHHHLSCQVGKTHQILMENPNMGRTEQFAEVSFVTPQVEGQIVKATILAIQDKQLMA